MPAYANHDAEQVAHGIRLGGRGHLIDTAPASQLLDIEALERIACPDLYEPDENGERHPAGGMGTLRLYQVKDTYTVACEWFGWLPGHYTTREAALTAYGYVLGGENVGLLEKLAAPRPEGYTLTEIEAFAAAASTG